MELPAGLTGPVQVALARPVEQIPRAGALPGGARYEPKWDGYRVATARDQTEARLWSRRGTDLTTVFPEIAAAATEQLRPGTVLDGELVVWADGRLAFAVLQTRMGRGPRTAASLARTSPASYAAFDVLAEGGRDMRPRPFDDRRRLLEQLATEWAPPLNLSPVTGDRATALEWFETYAAVGIEGLVVKGGGEPYPAGRRAWLKIKRRTAVDVVCGAVIGTRSSPQQVVAGLPIDGRLRVVGRTGPLSLAARRDLAQWLVPPVGEHSWPTRLPASALGRFSTAHDDLDLTLVEPLVIEVSADAGWDGSTFRHLLRFSRPRPDAEVASVTTPDR